MSVLILELFLGRTCGFSTGYSASLFLLFLFLHVTERILAEVRIGGLVIEGDI